MGVLKLKLTTARSSQSLTALFERVGPTHAIAQNCSDFINSIQTGTELAQGTGVPPSINIIVQGNEVYASGTVTFSAAGTAGDQVIVNGVTFTANAVAGANQWAIGATATASAAGLAAAINASVTALVANYVSASSALGVCTVTSLFPSLSGNQATFAKGTDFGTVMTVSGTGRLTGGAADPTAQTLSF